MTEIDGQEIIVLSAEQIEAMAQAVEDGSKYYLFEDKGGKLRFGALEEIPAHLRRGTAIPLGRKPQ